MNLFLCAAFLLVFANAKISAKSTSAEGFTVPIGELRTLAEEAAKQNILTLLNRDEGEDVKVISLDQLATKPSKEENMNKMEGPQKYLLRYRGKDPVNHYLTNEDYLSKSKSQKLKKVNRKGENPDIYTNNINSNEASGHKYYEKIGPAQYATIHDDFYQKDKNENEKPNDGGTVIKVVTLELPTDEDFKLLSLYNQQQKSDSLIKRLQEFWEADFQSKYKPYYNTLDGYSNNEYIRKKKARYCAHKQRFKRNTQAGYTQDPDTCKKYNMNLEKMWDTLSKYLNATDLVSELALHNIAVIVKAYLDHQNEHSRKEKVAAPQEKKNDKMSGVLRQIKKMLYKEDATVKVKEIVLENFKPEYDTENPDCKQTNEDNLVSSIDLSYKNYLDNAKCHGDYDTGLLRSKALLRVGLSPNTKTVSKNLFLDPHVAVNTIIDETESSKEFTRGKLPVYERSKRRNRFNRRVSKRRRRSSILKRKPKKNTKKTYRPRKKTKVHTGESCVKYAIRKFLITLRTSIERFMDLRDCVHDDTLRILNHNKSVLKPNRIPVLPHQNYLHDMKVLATNHIGHNEQKPINNYFGKIKDFQDQGEAEHISGPRQLHYSCLKMKCQIKGPYNDYLPSEYNFDSVYK